MHVARFAALGLLALLAGCNTAKLTPQSDQDASCPIQIEYPCKAGPIGAAGCGVDAAASDSLEGRIATDASYPNGCTVIVPALAPDLQGNCIIDGTCRCVVPEAGAPSWTCSPPQ